MNVRFQNALKRVPQNIPPVWMMRQAGRYHSHYRELRSRHSFMDLCLNPELASEVALGPVLDFDFDAAILFSDLLFPLDALGMGLSYPEGGPELAWYLEPGNISNLKDPKDVFTELIFQKEALQLTRKKIPADKSLIGFVGGAFTLFAYAVEGTHGKGLTKTKKMLPFYNAFCERLLPLVEKQIKFQLEGGAEVVMIFDTAAGELSPELFKRLVLPGIRKLSEVFPGKLGYYASHVNDQHYLDPNFSDSSLAGFGVDHRFGLQRAFETGKRGFVQGNFDQSLLHSSPDEFRRLLDEWLAPLLKLSAEQRRGWICGLGHGVLPATPEENVRTFVKHVREVFA